MAETDPLDGDERPDEASLGFRPLYARVREKLMQRIADGTWQPGQILPSEAQIAQELGVSPGTVRKALDDMTAAKLLRRRQGRGTFVAKHDEARILFQFFKLKPDEGPPVFPESTIRSVERGKADRDERARLGLSEGEEVIRIRRVRSLAGRAAISEYISVPASLFGGLESGPIPNNLYEVYSTRFGVTVARGREQLKAVPARAMDAAVVLIVCGKVFILF